jgi:uncharacterized protein (UPF0262 family)
MAIKARFTGGDNEFLEGIPAQSLDEEAYDALSTEDRERVRKSAIFDVKTEREMHPAPKAAESAAPKKEGEG